MNIRRLFIALFLTSVVSFGYANDENDEDADDVATTEIEIKKGYPSGYPKKPSAQRIQCIYSNGEMFIFFAIPEGECKITVYDYITGNIKWYVEDSNEDIVIQTGKLKSAGIEILTENGHLYSGEF